MFDLLLSVGVFFSLGFFIPNRWDGDELFTFSLCGLVLILSLFVKKKRELNLRFIGIFLLTIFIDFLLNLHVVRHQVFTNIMIGALALKAISERTSMNFKRVGFLIIAYALVCNAFIALQLLHKDPVFLPWFHELSGATVMPWIMGCIAALSIPFISKVNPIACIILLPMLWFSKSLACVSVASLMFLWPFLSKRKFVYFGLVSIITLAYAYFFGKIPNPSRFAIWKGCLKYLHNVWIGNGIGAWAHEGFLKMNGATPEYWRWAHNDIFQIFFEGGLLCLAGVIAFVTGLLRGRNSSEMAAIVGILLLSLVHPIFHCGNLLMLLIVILAVILKKDGEAWDKTKLA